MFKVTRGSGFQMTFGNGWTVSVQWGGGTYSSNYSQTAGKPQETALSAEIAAWDKAGNWHNFGDEYDVAEVRGYCTAGDVARFIAYISEIPPEVKE